MHPEGSYENMSNDVCDAWQLLKLQWPCCCQCTGTAECVSQTLLHLKSLTMCVRVCLCVQGLYCGLDSFSYTNINAITRMPLHRCCIKRLTNRLLFQLTTRINNASCCCSSFTSTWWLLTLKEERNGTQSLFDAQASHFSHDWLWHEVRDESSMGLLPSGPCTDVDWWFLFPLFCWSVFPSILLECQAKQSVEHHNAASAETNRPHASEPLLWLDSGIIYQTITQFPPTANRRWTQTSLKNFRGSTRSWRRHLTIPLQTVGIRWPKASETADSIGEDMNPV